MTFIFPRNYNFKNKFLGMIDYQTLVILFFWSAFIYCSINFFNIAFTTKVILFIIFTLPIDILGIFSFSNDSILYTFLYVFKYLMSPKLYLFSKKD